MVVGRASFLECFFYVDFESDQGDPDYDVAPGGQGPHEAGPLGGPRGGGRAQAGKEACFLI